MEEWEGFFSEIGSDPAPLLYRVFKSTVQRVPPLVTSLNSHACFLLIIPKARKIAGWNGYSVSKSDVNLMQEIAQEIFLRDFGDKSSPSFPVLVEGRESLDVLEKFLDIIWAVPTAYQSRMAMAERRTLIYNHPVSVGTLALSHKGGEKFDLQESAFAHPDANGAVPRVTFPQIEQATIAFVNVGDQWDLWFARGVDASQRRDALAFIQAFVETQATNAAEDVSSINREALKHYVVCVEQGDETVVFRRPIKIFTDYEPPGRTLPRQQRPQSVVRGHAMQEATTTTSSSAAATAVAASKGMDSSMESKPLASLSVSPRNAMMEDGITLLNVDENEFNRTDFWHDVSPVDGKGSSSQRAEAKGMSALSKLDATTGLFTITPNMLEIVENENLTVERRRLLQEEASFNPAALVGWQIVIDEGLYRGVFVVVGFKKSLIRRKTYFHLAAMHGDEVWVRLKRSDRKAGVVFRPLRQVAVLQ